MINFVYGEIWPCSVAALLAAMAPKPGEALVDLGSGAGKVVLLASSLYPALKGCKGLEMMGGYMRDAQAATALLAAARVRSHRGQAKGGKGVAAPVEWWAGDFLSPAGLSAWAAASLVVACSTCFDAATMAGIAEGCARSLPPGARVLTLDKPLPTPRAQVQDPTPPFLGIANCSPSILTTKKETQRIAARALLFFPISMRIQPMPWLLLWLLSWLSWLRLRGFC
jgi:hypothetical protein